MHSSGVESDDAIVKQLHPSKIFSYDCENFIGKPSPLPCYKNVCLYKIFLTRDEGIRLPISFVGLGFKE